MQTQQTLSGRLEAMLERDGVEPFLPGEPIISKSKWGQQFSCPLCKYLCHRIDVFRPHALRPHYPCPNGCGMASPKLGPHMRHCQLRNSPHVLGAEAYRLSMSISEDAEALEEVLGRLEALSAHETELEELRTEAKSLFDLLDDPHPGLSSWTGLLKRRVERVRELTSHVGG